MDRRVRHGSWIALAAVSIACVGCGYPDYVYADGDDPGADGGIDGALLDGEVRTDDGTDPDSCFPNLCGGCKTLGVKGDRCGTCGQIQCNGTDVKCVESMPAPGTTCGVCHTSKYTCGALGDSSCALSDDRTTFEDLKFEAKDAVVFTLDHTTEVVATYATTRPITYSDAAFILRRIDYKCAHVAALPHPDPSCSSCAMATSGGFDCTIPAPLVSEITVTLYSGSPDKTLTPLATAKLLDSSKVSTGPTFTTATFIMETPPVPVGTQLSVGITTTSTAYAFEISGGGTGAFPPAPGKMSWFHRTVLPSPGAFVEEPTTDTALVVHGKACPP